jgi:hypothetical protein
VGILLVYSIPASGARTLPRILRAAKSLPSDESEWRDDPAALADWGAWIQTIEPLEFTPEEVRQMVEFNERMRQANVEAVRRQMRESAGE